MNDKTKRIILITACCLLCGVAVIGIAGRFGGNTVTPSGTVSGSQPDSNDPNVNINNSQGDVNVPSLTPDPFPKRQKILKSLWLLLRIAQQRRNTCCPPRTSRAQPLHSGPHSSSR